MKFLIDTRTRHLAEWRVLLFTVIVTVTKNTWNVKVIGINITSLRKCAESAYRLVLPFLHSIEADWLYQNTRWFSIISIKWDGSLIIFRVWCSVFVASRQGAESRLQVARRGRCGSADSRRQAAGFVRNSLHCVRFSVLGATHPLWKYIRAFIAVLSSQSLK